MKFWTLILASTLAFTSLHADASKRLGGGKSVGQQSNSATQNQAAKPAAPAQATPAAPPPAAAQPQRRPWGAMLGGLAAGLGLAWLAHSLGLGAEFGQFLMFGLLALAIMMVVGYFLRRRQAQSASSPFAFEGVGAPTNPKARPNTTRAMWATMPRPGRGRGKPPPLSLQRLGVKA